jgi:hypothetical protein
MGPPSLQRCCVRGGGRAHSCASHNPRCVQSTSRVVELVAFAFVQPHAAKFSRRCCSPTSKTSLTSFLKLWYDHSRLFDVRCRWFTPFPRFQINDIDAAIFRLVLQALYTDSVTNLSARQVAPALNAAKKYQVRSFICFMSRLIATTAALCRRWTRCLRPA